MRGAVAPSTPPAVTKFRWLHVQLHTAGGQRIDQFLRMDAQQYVAVCVAAFSPDTVHRDDA